MVIDMNKFYLKYMKNALIKQKKNIIIQIGIICLESLIAAILPMIHQSIINDVFIKNNFSNFNNLILIMIILYLVQCGFDILKDFFQAKIGANIKYELRRNLNNCVLNKRYLEFLKQGNEKVISRYSNDTGVIAEHFSRDVFGLFEQIVILFLAIFMIVRISCILLICMILFLALYYILNKKIGFKLQSEIKKLCEYQEKSLGYFTENYSNNLLVKIYNLYNWIDERFCSIYKKEYRQNIKTNVIYSFNFNVTKLSVNVLVIFSWIVGGYYIKTGRGTVGNVVALTEYVSLLVSPFFYFGQFNNSLQEANTSIERFEKELDIPSEDINSGKDISEITDIFIKHIFFQYKKDGFKLDIENIYMKKGEIIGLKGESGCGKTTLVNLLMRLYSASLGTIYINNEDCRNFKLRDIRNHIGYVPQNSLFFEGTIRENLFGNYEQKDIDKFAEKIDVYQDIEQMPKGFEYILKKNASNISGGQQKRIDILRVLLADKDVVIFDEATAMLDKKRRDVFFELLMELKKDKIIIMITHDSSEWNYFDKIYEL